MAARNLRGADLCRKPVDQRRQRDFHRHRQPTNLHANHPPFSHGFAYFYPGPLADPDKYHHPHGDYYAYHHPDTHHYTHPDDHADAHHHAHAAANGYTLAYANRAASAIGLRLYFASASINNTEKG